MTLFFSLQDLLSLPSFLAVAHNINQDVLNKTPLHVVELS